MFLMNTNNVNILVVDDDKNTRNYIAKILSMKYWNVDTAGDGQSALELVRGKKYDAMVLDFRMPGMDGAELCRRIRKFQPNVHGVFLTAFANINTVFPAMDAGGERVLAKPVDPKELIQVLEEQLTGANASTAGA
jgi:CheY-like chemotaxis protein